ncbi:TetR/AcrR family transcriptional regulator [Rhodococcus sp. NPDC058505]|uniref:TetR/AcrR family transcriptional regulator n=1 Tax=unclassified Rhodococcus (in: high G+C Gram-positive bacteria) TaxID=192944 RepID=UPI00365FEC63
MPTNPAPRPGDADAPAERTGSGHEARWERHNRERQTRILRAAVELLEEAPPGADIPVKLIAQRAGLAKSVVYRQFSGRDDLDCRIRAHMIDEFIRTLEARLDISSGSVAQILERTIRAAVDWMSDHPRLNEFARTGPVDRAAGVDAVSTLTARMAARSHDLIASIAAAIGVDDGAFATVPFAVVTMVEGTLTQWVRDPAPTRDRDQIVADLAGYAWFVLDGVARSVGVVLDPSAELREVIARLAVGAAR